MPKRLDYFKTDFKLTNVKQIRKFQVRTLQERKKGNLDTTLFNDMRRIARDLIQSHEQDEIKRVQDEVLEKMKKYEHEKGCQ